MTKVSLSATIITLNEEKDLPRCITSIKSLVDEVVVVDSGSKDRTVDIAKELGAKVFFKKFDNYANQKNFAMAKTTGDWIISLDADEEISPELATEIRSLLTSDLQSPTSNIIAYSIPRKNFIFGEFIKHTRWQPELDRHIWLWQKAKGEWVGDVHEEVSVNGEVGKLKNPKIHYQYETVKDFLDMMNQYSNLESKQMIAKGIKFSNFKLFSTPIYNFFVRYFYRLGFLDGWRGFTLSYLMAVYHLEVWFKLWSYK
jgi:glycosyltransferase involved in cell wall biosynthesis